MSISDRIEKLLLKAEIGKPLGRGEILELLKMPGDLAPDLFAAADRVRKNDVGNEIHLRGIIEFSNFCERNCLYCGLRQANESLERYRMSDAEILATAREIRASGIATVVLQSGEDAFYDADKICRLVESIKKETGLVVTLSLGERPPADYRAFLDAGVGRYLLKHETASPELYKYLRPGCRLDHRVTCLKTLKELGFETGAGNMVGLPGQTHEILADDLLLIRLIDADMLGIGPFIPHPATPLAGI
ncbi:MAG: radical SAM protein, partial [Smithellaceae bacterium]|nr:radical SAM protein [Smithellaceae bacterium]